MKTKKLLVFLLVALFSFFDWLEYLYRSDKLLRHELDYQIEKIVTIRDTRFETLFLSDSITRTPLWNIPLKPEVANLTSSAAVSVAGNYFLLKRFLDQGLEVLLIGH